MPQSSVDPVVAQNLRETLKSSGRSAYAVATALGHAPNWLYRVINGESGILIPTLREVAEELGVSAGSLLDKPEDANGPIDVNGPIDDTVWLVEVRAKPESGAARYDETFRRRVRFPKALLPYPDLDPFFCQLVRIEGKELEPSFSDGTIILLDRLRRDLKDGGTFALVTVEGLLVREVGFDEIGREWFIRDKGTRPYRYAFTDDIHIVGQVIGAWKSLL